MDLFKEQERFSYRTYFFNLNISKYSSISPDISGYQNRGQFHVSFLKKRYTFYSWEKSNDFEILSGAYAPPDLIHQGHMTLLWTRLCL